jgi:hypothetical protein
MPQRLVLADGTFFPPRRRAILWGRASTPAGVAPEALQERGCSRKVFSLGVPMCEVLVQPASTIFQPTSAVPCARIWHTSAFGAFPGGVAMRQGPEARPS